MSGYVLVTPCRNEMDNLPTLIASVQEQQRPPLLWVVVDDFSEDGSWEYLQQRQADVPFLRARRAPEEPDEYLGHHVATVKSWGMGAALHLADEEGLDVGYAGVLDADIVLPPEHYERLTAALEEDPELGVVSSVLASPSEEGPRLESMQRSDRPRGPTQFFRRACLEEIGGLPTFMGYDGAANVKAMARGWRAKVLLDVVAQHARYTATRFGIEKGFARKGRYAWFLGYHPALVALRTLTLSLPAPHSGGYHFLRGWAKEAVLRAERCPDEDVRRYYGKVPNVRRGLKEYGRLLVGRVRERLGA